LSLVVVCDDGPLLLHWTVVPTLTDSVAGEKEKSWIVTRAGAARRRRAVAAAHQNN